jgi:hypothetical protein
MHRSTLLAIAFLLAACAAAPRAEETVGTDIIQCEMTLPKGEVYMRGATDPVADLEASLVLTNTTPADQRAKVHVETREASFLTPAQFRELSGTEMSSEELARKLEEITKSLSVEKLIQVEPVNKASLGVAYAPPLLGTQDLIEFVITKLPEGEAPAEAAKPRPVARDMPVEHTAGTDIVRSAYLAPGEKSPAYVLPVGRFYRVREPGRYSMKAILRDLPDSRTPSGRVESNTVEFRVLPYKVLDQKIAALQESWAEFERGHPDFDYMFYQLLLSAPYQEIYYVQRLTARGIERWEWHRLCTVAPGADVQVAQVTPTKVALLAPHMKGDAGLYTVDFAKVDPEVTAKVLPVVEGKVPTLVVEGGVVEAK